MILLHDGLGSISQWRDVPAEVHRVTGRTVLAYDRAGHGASLPVPTGPWPADWLHREAEVLVDLLTAVGADRPLLVGHSDGGSIALLAAAAAAVPCSGVVAIAAHSWVEQVCVDAISAMRSAPDRWIAGLGRHHEHPAAVFDAWSGVWTGDAFRSWDVRPLLGAIDLPVLVLQGDGDEYATDSQLHLTVEAIGGEARGELLAGVGHLVPHQAPEVLVDRIASAATGW